MGAQTEGAERGLNRVTESTAELNANVAKSAAIVGAAILAWKGFGAVLSGISSQIGAINQQFTEIDRTAKAAAKLGTSFEELEQLELAGQLGGVENIDTALQRMVRRVSEAAAGLGEAQGALEELNLDAAQLNKLSPFEQFQAISEAMESIGNQGDRLRLTVKIFDTEGAGLVNVFGDAVQRAGEETARLQDGLGALDPAGVERMNDAFTILFNVIDRIRASIADDFAPVLEEFAVLMTDLLIETLPLWRDLGEIIRSSAATLRNFTQGLRELGILSQRPALSIVPPERRAQVVPPVGAGVGPGGGLATTNIANLLTQQLRLQQLANDDLGRLLLQGQDTLPVRAAEIRNR